jgi:hypothetical protein
MGSEPHSPIAHYFGLGDDEPSEHLVEPAQRREWIVSIVWLIVALIVAGVVTELLAVWALPAPVDFVAAMGIAVLTGTAAGALQLVWDWAAGSY